MKFAKTFVAIASMVLVNTATVVTTAAAAETADDIMQRNFYATKVQALTSTSTMQLIGSSGETRERKIHGVARLEPNGIDSNVVINFDSPADVRGTRFLQKQHSERDDDMWIYLPALHKTRRLISSNKRDSFVGTDFSYGDILPLNPENFDNKILREEKLDGVDCLLIESTAKDADYERDLGYSRRLMWIRKDNAIEIKVDYYDSQKRLIKTQTTAQHELADAQQQRWVVKRREMIDRDRDHRTVITLDNVDTQSAIPDRAFRVESLGER
jgi:Outer membrane lipoprotein-sorting protein